MSLDEAPSFQRLHHLIDRGSRYQKVPLDVRLGRRPAKASDVLGDERQVVLLALRWAGLVRRERLNRKKVRDQPFVRGLYDQSQVVFEVKYKGVPSVYGDVRYSAASDLGRERFGVG